MISRASKAARISWSAAYLFFLLAGIVAFFAPAQIVERVLVEVLVYAWASFLIVGGGLCLGGKVRGNWVGEIIGLPLLATANYIFGILLFAESETTAAIAIGGVFLGIGTSLIGRWIELLKLSKDNQGVNSEL